MDKWVIRKNVKNPNRNGKTGTSREQLNLNPSQETGTVEIHNNILTPPDHIDLTHTTADFERDFEVENQVVVSAQKVTVEPSPLNPEVAEITPSPPNQEIAKITKPTAKKREYKFKNEWLHLPEFRDWLTKGKQGADGREMAHCKICDTNIFSHKTDLLRHSKSEKHLTCFRQIKTTRNLEKMFTPLPDEVKLAELKLCALIATNNLPFSLMDTLTKLCGNIFPDSNIAKNLSVQRTKATAIVRESLGKNFKENLYSQFREKGIWFSLIMDETTDVAGIKQCAFTIIYFCDMKNKVATSFFDMVEVANGNAINLYESLKKCLLDKKIPITNLVGFSSDTTNVMVGEHRSVFSHLKADLPEIVCVKCSCHMIHLAASKSCLQLPRSVEDMLRNIGSHFSRSFSRQQKLKEFQEFFKVDIHKILLPSVTRWLSVEQCTNRVLEQYEVLKAYFRETSFEDPSKTNLEIIKCLDNVFTKIYLEFMSYVLNILNNFNVLFQSDVPLLHRLKPEVTRMLKILYSNYIKKEYFNNVDIFSFDHKNPRQFVPLQKIYVGISGQESIQNILADPSCSKPEIELFYKTCLSFYIELISEIKSRFDFADSIYDLISVLNPDVAQSFEIKSLLPIIKRFSFLKNFVTLQKLDNEWREHALLNHEDLGLGSGLPPDEYWPKVFRLKNAANVPLFPNLKIVLGLLLILPFSNASVERIFSKVNLIKTDNRNKLKTETLSALLFTKEGIEKQGGCYKFVPTKEMLSCNIWKA